MILLGALLSIALTGPIGGPEPPSIGSTAFSLAPFGYAQEEYFLSGTATAWGNDGDLGSDGRWSVSPGATAAYTTRILVRRPVAREPSRRTVVVEWLNVSGGFDDAPEWTFAHTMLLREGIVWVGVSAQYVGVSGGPPLNLDRHLKAVDPVRYGPLDHPGDAFSYDVFSQAGLVIGRHAELLFGDARPMRLLAAGESQSAFRLVTYVNAIHLVARVFDGFLLHSRGGGAAPLSDPAITMPDPARIRGDADVPVLTLVTETDVVAIGFHAARQPDGANHRTWEVAGTAHADTYLMVEGATDAGRAALDTTHRPPVRTVFGGALTCDLPINAGPQHYVVSAALRQLARWVWTGRAPASMPPLSLRPGAPPAIERDDLGNAVGGVRTPQVDAPVAVLSGTGQALGSACSRFGTTRAFDGALLDALYPSHRAYVRAVRRATKQAVRRGVVLPIDAMAIRSAAASSDVGR